VNNSTFINVEQVASSVPFDNSTNSFTAEDVQAAIEEARSAALGKRAFTVFVSNGATTNKWLVSWSASDPSDQVPHILVHGIDVTDIEFYKNGSLWFTAQIRNKRFALKSDATTFNKTALRGDRISCFARKVTSGTGISNPNSMTVVIYYAFNENSDADEGRQTNVTGAISTGGMTIV
jgi:hypothetical protein